MGFDHNTMQYRYNINTWLTESQRMRIIYSGLWPVYWVDVVDLDLIADPAELHKLSKDYRYRKYFFLKRNMISHLTKLRFKHPDASIEKF